MSLNLNNAVLLELLKRDVGAFNRYRENNPDESIDFYSADLTGAYLQGADLYYANLQDTNLRGADLRDANLRYADLTGANLRGAGLRDASLRDSDLTGAYLQGADLEGVMFSLAKLKGTKLPYNAPVVPNIHQQLADVVNKNNLDMRDWHTCKTTHCRAGWVVTLAGKPGLELEEKIGTNAAAALIYMASDPDLEQIPDWVASNEDALADIQAMAAK